MAGPTAVDPLLGIDFRTALREVREGQLVKPVLRNFLDDTATLRWPGMPERDFGDRPPDGWFHPSTHPLWADRALYEYLVHPLDQPKRSRTYQNVLSLVVGTAIHAFLQDVLERAGVLPAELQRCTLCPPEVGCREPGVQDVEAGERGHLDGLLALPGSYPGADVLEIKTTNERRLTKIEDLDTDAFRATWPEYWAQQQSYLRMSGRRRSIVLMMSLGYPWHMREFHIPFDRGHCNGLRQRYLDVRQAVADQRPPRCGCVSAERQGCAARAWCA